MSGFLKMTGTEESLERLRTKLKGKGNVYYSSGALGFIAGDRTEKRGYGTMGYQQMIQSCIAAVLDECLSKMEERARRNFQAYMSGMSESYPSHHSKKTVDDVTVYSSDAWEHRMWPYKANRAGYDMVSDQPIMSCFFHRMDHGGKRLSGSFGNTSYHARFVEWGTGPVGEANYESLSETTRDYNQKPNYRQTPWTYWNPTVDHFVKTSGMPPRPFVYPAFLALKGSLISDIEAILRGKGPRFFRGVQPD